MGGGGESGISIVKTLVYVGLVYGLSRYDQNWRKKPRLAKQMTATFKYVTVIVAVLLFYVS